MADNTDIGQIDNYSFGRSGNSNIITSDIVYKPLTSANHTKYSTTIAGTGKNYIIIEFTDIEISGSKLLSVIITTSGNKTITGISTSVTKDTSSGKITAVNDIEPVNYILNNCSFTVPIMKDNVSILALQINSVNDITVNGVWVNLNNADSNFFQLQSQIAGLQMQASSMIQQLNNAKQYCSAIMAMNSKYMVGDLYITTNDKNPQNYFGGTWEPLSNCILVSKETDETFTCTTTLPSSISCNISLNQIPYHTHRVGYWT